MRLAAIWRRWKGCDPLSGGGGLLDVAEGVAERIVYRLVKLKLIRVIFAIGVVWR